MKILVDADACPVVAQTAHLAEKYHVQLELFCDTSHILNQPYAQIHIIGAGRDAVDVALINHCASGDIVITQDYALAAMVLAKKAYALNQNGRRYTEENIDTLLGARWLSSKTRRSTGKNHLKGPKKRTAEDDKNFERALEKLLQALQGQSEG